MFVVAGYYSEVLRSNCWSKHTYMSVCVKHTHTSRLLVPPCKVSLGVCRVKVKGRVGSGLLVVRRPPTHPFRPPLAVLSHILFTGGRSSRNNWTSFCVTRLGVSHKVQVSGYSPFGSWFSLAPMVYRHKPLTFTHSGVKLTGLHSQVGRFL